MGKARGRPRKYRYNIKCPNCNSNWCKKNGYQNGKQRYRCNECGKTFTLETSRKHPEEKKSFAVKTLPEEMSISSVSRTLNIPEGRRVFISRRKYFSIINVIVVAIVILLWLYATGNLPGIWPSKSLFIIANASYPKVAMWSFMFSYRIVNILRQAGLKVPLSANEEILRILEIRRQVSEQCDKIISQIHVKRKGTK